MEGGPGPPEPYGWSLAGVWRWMLVLWGVAIVAFFKAFGGQENGGWFIQTTSHVGEDHLRAAEEGELLAGVGVGDDRVLYLGRAATVSHRRLALYDVLVLSAEEVAL